MLDHPLSVIILGVVISVFILQSLYFLWDTFIYFLEPKDLSYVVYFLNILFYIVLYFLYKKISSEKNVNKTKKSLRK